MSAEIADRLRTLAHEHHEGRLHLAAYRALRGPLLDSLSSGASSPPIEITEPRVAHRQMQRDAITRPGRPYVATASEPESATAPGWFGSVPLSDGLAPQGAGSLLQGAGSAPPGAGPTSGGIGSATQGTVSAPHGAGSAPQRTVSAPQGSESMPTLGRSKPLVGVRHRLVVWTAAAMVAVAAGAVWIWLQHRHAGSPEVESGANSATAQPGAARSAVEQFMDGSDWSDGRLAALNATLMELGGEQIAPLTREAGFQRFVDELRRRLKEQQALSPITLTVNNSPLAALAVTVGLDLNSPDSALHISAAPQVHDAQSATGVRQGEAKGGRVTTSGQPAASVAGTMEPKPEFTASAASRAGAATSTNATSNDATGNNATGNNATNGNTTSNTGTSNSTTGGNAISDASASSTPIAGPAELVGATASGRATVGTVLAAKTTATASAAAVRSSKAASSQPTGAEAQADNCRRELIHTRRPLCQDSLPSGSDAPALALIPAGAFEMGSTEAPEEQPVHHVTISDAFAISMYEISQGEFKRYCEALHRQCPTQPWSGDDYPVVNVGWDDARGYVDWLTSVTHHHYSLPTEAQWEYAARAGNTGLFPSGTALSPTDAHFSMLKKLTIAAPRSQKFNPNAFKLVHTVGNVREWVEDSWSPTYAGAPNDGSVLRSARPAMRVARGGSYMDGSARLRLSMREGLVPDTRDVTTGFRIVRELQ